MVFAKIVSKIIQSTLGEYAEFITGLEDMSMGYWQGEVEMHNLSIKNQITDALQLPFNIDFSHIKKLKATIPWSNIGSQPITIE